MTKKIVISEKDNIGAVLDNGKVSEFFVHKGDVLMGDVFLSQVDNILPSIDAAFVNVGLDRMGFIHNSDIQGTGNLKEKVKPKQKLIVQVVKEPTGHKGPRVTTALSLPGRFLVLLPEEKGVNVSKKITSQKERARLKALVSLLKPVGVGIIVRTEAEGQNESEIQEDVEILLEKWNSIVSAADNTNPPALLYRDQDLLYRVIREACTDDVDELIVDTSFSQHRATQLLQHWNMQNKIKVTLHKGSEPLLAATGIHRELANALNTKVTLQLGGYLYIQQTEALTVVDVNSGKFTSSASQAETILKTNLQAADEIARQLKLRNIGGMIVVDFIDMNNRMDKLAVMEHFELALQQDKAKPQIGQLSDLGLVELTRHRQGQSLSEVFTKKCDKCSGSGFIVEEFKLSASNTLGEMKAKMSKIKGPFNQNPNAGGPKPNKFNKNRNNNNNSNGNGNIMNNNRKGPGAPVPNKDNEDGPAIEILEKILAPILEEPIRDIPQVNPEPTVGSEPVMTPEPSTQSANDVQKRPSRRAKKSMKKDEAVKEQDVQQENASTPETKEVKAEENNDNKETRTRRTPVNRGKRTEDAEETVKTPEPTEEVKNEETA